YENMPLYAAFPSNYPRKVNIWINHEWYNTYLTSSSDDGIIPLGQYASDDQVSLIMTILSKDDDGSAEVFLKDKLFYYFDEALFEEYFSVLRNSVTNFEMESDTRISFTVEADGSHELYTSIPYERGWIATVDGKEVEVFRSENGMVGIDLSAGKHDVVLRFMPDYFVFSVIISGAALLLFVLIIVAHKLLLRRGVKLDGVKSYLEIEDDNDDPSDSTEDIEEGSGNTVALIGEMLKADPDEQDPKAFYDEIFGSSAEKASAPEEQENKTTEEESPEEEI
ncbi:MAG: YfhO family protein, partial [Clostridia bacterium]|nr:YfhO family protein [Clostridia bacterium]